MKINKRMRMRREVVRECAKVKKQETKMYRRKKQGYMQAKHRHIRTHIDERKSTEERFHSFLD